MIWDIVFVVIGIGLTILGANWLVDGSASFARRFGVSDLVIGLTIVAIGTSTPELVVSVLSAINGIDDIAIGNILGSNIANILLILGVTALIYPLQIQTSSKWKEIPFSLLAIVAIAVLSNDILFDSVNTQSNFLSRGDGIVLLLFLAIFFVYTFGISKNKNQNDTVTKPMAMWKSISFVIVGISALFVGGKLLVDGAVGTAKLMGISERVIGLTIVAVGTSVPELVTSIVAAFKRNADIAVGNILGSNIVNIFLILGISATIHPLEFQPESNIDIMVGIFSTLLLFVSTLAFGVNLVKRREGLFFVLFYIAYVVFLLT